MPKTAPSTGIPLNGTMEMQCHNGTGVSMNYSPSLLRKPVWKISRKSVDWTVLFSSSKQTMSFLVSMEQLGREATGTQKSTPKVSLIPSSPTLPQSNVGESPPQPVAVPVPFLTQSPSSPTSQPADGNPGVFPVPAACKGLQCPQALTSLSRGSLRLLWALWGSGSFNFL